MTAERWAQIKQLFDEAVEQPASERESFVCARSNGDSELCEEALAMLRNSGAADGLLDISLLGRQWVMPVVLARSLMPGQILAGRYRIVRPIGAGGMGEVYEAEDLDLGARAAVKTMRIEDPDALARFKREIQLARTVTHPNVCRLFDMQRHHEPGSGRVITFLTMELLEGETLAEHLSRSGALSPAQALPMVRGIAAALAAAHERGVVHRDLKAANVILTAEDGRVVVTDFGLAAPLAQATGPTVTITGTPAYMAPEQFEGKSVTAAADIYAFGVLLYEMVVGRRPFEGASPIALALEKIRKQPPLASDAAPDLPTAWSAAIRRCMDPLPERRFANINDALRNLEENVSRRPLLRLTRRQKTVLASAACIATLLAAAAWRYTQSAYAPGREALRLYRLGIHSEQLGLPWKASQLFERALENDSRFVGARVHLAEAWIDLEQPSGARTELQHAAQMRPRWQRVPMHESLLEQAANARLNGDLTGSARLHERATAAAPRAEMPDLRFSEARAKTRAGDLAGAAALYGSMAAGPPCRGPAMLAQAIVMFPRNAPMARRLFENSVHCFEAAGDLDGVAQSWYEGARLDSSEPSPVRFDSLRRAAAIAHVSGNIEQQIWAAALQSESMLETGDEEAAYISFSQAMQLVDRHELRFFSARLLNERAQYFFDKGDFLQAGHYGALASSLSRSAQMPWTNTRCYIRNAKLALRMNFPDQALNSVAHAGEQLHLFPNAALSAELAQLAEQARHTPSRPEAGSLTEPAPASKL